MSSIQDMYAANLRQSCGYPLHSPAPKNELGEPYKMEGLQIGDVGYVNSQGGFDVLFNIGFPDKCHNCDAQPSLIEPVKFGQPHMDRSALCKGHVFMTDVRKNVDTPSPEVAYGFTAKSKAGAFLILPSGATLSELQSNDLETFREVATKYAHLWCKRFKGDSLYLVTGMYKTRHFALASFNTGDPGEKILVKRRGDNDTGTYEWECAFETYFRAGPQNNRYENQTILIKGFRMTVRLSLPVVERVTQAESPIMRWITFHIATLFALLGFLCKWLSRLSGSFVPRATIEHVPPLSQPLHPADIINRFLLDKDPRALVAITHDNEWIDMLKRERLQPEDLMQEDLLRKFLEKEYTWYSDRDVVYLQSQIENTDKAHYNSESSQPISATENVQIAITHIRAENITAGLGRVPIGFYVQVDIPDCPPRQTKNKSVPVYDRVIQWDDLIHLPTDTSIMVKLTVYASFEFAPMVGRGESLYSVEKSVGELLSRTNPFAFFDEKRDDVLPCTSLFVAVQEWHCNHRTRGSSEGGVAGACFLLDCEESPELLQATEATDKGHEALLHYQTGHNEENLKSSVTHFECALANFPGEHPCRAAALFNLATAEFVAYRSDGTSQHVDTSTFLYQQALELRRDGHQDRPMTLLHLAQVILYRYGADYEASTDDKLCKLVDELKNSCPDGTHARRAADLVLQTYERLRLRDSNDLGRLNELISTLDAAAQEPPEVYFDRPTRFNNLGLALQRRVQLQRKADDLDQAIEWLEKAVRITPDSHLDKSNYLSNLGNALLVRFQRQQALPLTRQ